MNIGRAVLLCASPIATSIAMVAGSVSCGDQFAVSPKPAGSDFDAANDVDNSPIWICAPNADCGSAPADDGGGDAPLEGGDEFEGGDATAAGWADAGDGNTTEGSRPPNGGVDSADSTTTDGSGPSDGRGDGPCDGGACCINGCTPGQTSCLPGGRATCTLGSNGCWSFGAPATCGRHQSCVGAAGTGMCACNADPVCAASGQICASASTLATCSQDADGCFYESASSSCTNGACSGGACCTNACTPATQCLSTSSVQIRMCAVGINGCTAWTNSTCTTGLVCERYGGDLCVDPSWAEWPMPNVQADVTAGAPNLASFTDNGNGTVTDNVTALVWEKTPPTTGTYTQAAALSYCAGLSLAGFTDWRLPSVVELFSILDQGANPSINATYFPGTAASYYWCSTPYAATVGDAWVVLFSLAYTSFDTASTTHFVRCVR